MNAMATTLPGKARIAGLAVLLLSGCFSPDYPATPFWCTVSEPYCPSGYVCAVDEGAPDPANPDHRLCKKKGGNPSGACLDSDLEPNNAADTATNLDASLQRSPQGVSLYHLEICAADDIDFYAFTVTERKRATVLVQYSRDQGELAADVLDPSLAVQASGSPVAGGLQLEAVLEPQAMPYYIRVLAGSGGATNRYDLSITFASP